MFWGNTSLGAHSSDETLKAETHDFQELTWEEGEPILIDDTFAHQVINERAGRRTILLLEVPRQDCGMILSPFLQFMGEKGIRWFIDGRVDAILDLQNDLLRKVADGPSVEQDVR